MTSQGQHFFLSYFKTLSVGRAGVRTSDPESCLDVADANPTELKRKHQVEAAYHVPPPKLSGVLTPRDLTLIKFYLWKDLMGERVLEIACSLTPYFLFRERRARV